MYECSKHGGKFDLSHSWTDNVKTDLREMVSEDGEIDLNVIANDPVMGFC